MMKALSAILFFLMTMYAFAQDDLAKGKDALSKGNYDAAIQSLQQYITANSRNAEAQTVLAEAFYKKGDFQKAQEAIERAIDLDDEYEPAVALSIRIYGKLNMWDKAQKSYTLASKYHKTGMLAPLAFAQTYLETDSLDKASIYFSRLKELDEKNVEAYIGLSEVYARQNVLVMAIENLRTATQINPNDPTLWYRLATTITKQRVMNSEHIKEVIAALQKSIDLDPNNNVAKLEAGNIFYKIKYWLNAAEFFKKYTDEVKDNPEAWEKYGISAYNAKATIDAISALETAIKMNPKKYELKPMLANSYYLNREYSKALALFGNIPPDSLTKEEIFRIGFSYFQIKDTASAVRFFEKASKFDTVSDKVYIDAIGSLAGISWAQKKYQNAYTWYEKLLDKDSENINALYFSGLSAANIDKPDSARRCFKKLVLMRPATFGYRYYLAQAYSNLDSIEESKYHYNVVRNQIDSLYKLDPEKSSQNIPLLISVYRALALFDYKEKDIKSSINKLEAAATYEKTKKDEGLHLFLAQMYAVYSGDSTLLAKEAKEIRLKSCSEYKLVLKINPKNASAKKESEQMNCGK